MTQANSRKLPENKYPLYERVEKWKGDARYSGTIQAIYYTRKRKLRYVIEVEPQGFQMIVSEQQIRRARKAKK